MKERYHIFKSSAQINLTYVHHVQTSKNQNKDNILNTDKEKIYITFREIVIKIIADLWAENIEPEDKGMRF